jgi:hypothetical protein
MVDLTRHAKDIWACDFFGVGGPCVASASRRLSTSHAARCTADHGSRAQPDPTIGVSECTIPAG